MFKKHLAFKSACLSMEAPAMHKAKRFCKLANIDLKQLHKRFNVQTALIEGIFQLHFSEDQATSINDERGVDKPFLKSMLAKFVQ